MPRSRAKAPEMVPASPPVRVEIRCNGRIRFVNTCYDVVLSQDGDAVTLTAALQPSLVEVTPMRPPERYIDDPRNGEEVITTVHSGRRE